MSNGFIENSVVEISRAIRSKSRSATDAVIHCKKAVDVANSQLNAFVQLDWEAAFEAASRIDSQIERGQELGPLTGVPFGIKDLEHCAGMSTSFGSLVYKNSPPQTLDDVHVARLRAAGAIPVGKTASSEFGMDQATRTRAWGVTRNPWNLEKTPGGSSGGSAAAVAAGMVPFATGTDAGGSIRDPAAFTSLVGLKPSHGRIAHPPQLSDLNVRGVLTKTVRDSARLLDVLAGPAAYDKSALPASSQPFEMVIETLRVESLRALWSSDLGGHAAVDPEVAHIAEAAADRLVKTAGLTRSTHRLRITNPSRIFRRLSGLEAHSTLRRLGMWPSRAADLCERTRMTAEVGERMTASDITDVLLGRHDLEAQVADLFSSIDLLLTPSCACPAFAASGPIPDTIDGKDASLGGAEPFGSLANICWLPSISVPAGLTATGLPVGLMITGPHHRDDVVLRLARLMEIHHPWETGPAL